MTEEEKREYLMDIIHPYTFILADIVRKLAEANIKWSSYSTPIGKVEFIVK